MMDQPDANPYASPAVEMPLARLSNPGDDGNVAPPIPKSASRLGTLNLIWGGLSAIIVVSSLITWITFLGFGFREWRHVTTEGFRDQQTAWNLFAQIRLLVECFSVLLVAMLLRSGVLLRRGRMAGRTWALRYAVGSLIVQTIPGNLMLGAMILHVMSPRQEDWSAAQIAISQWLSLIYTVLGLCYPAMVLLVARREKFRQALLARETHLTRDTG